MYNTSAFEYLQFTSDSCADRRVSSNRICFIFAATVLSHASNVYHTLAILYMIGGNDMIFFSFAFTDFYTVSYERCTHTNMSSGQCVQYKWMYYSRMTRWLLYNFPAWIIWYVYSYSTRTRLLVQITTISCGS